MDNKKNVLIFLGAGVLTLIAAIVGTTFAFFAITISGGSFTGGTASVGLKLTITPKSSGIENPLIPQETSAIANAVIGTNNGSCVDENGNTVCQVYEIMLENTGEAGAIVNVMLNLTTEGIQNLKWGIGTGPTTGFSSSKIYELTETDLVSPDVLGLQSITLKPKDNLVASGEDTAMFYIVIYIEEINSDQSSLDVGDFTGTVTVNAANGKGITATFTP